MRPANMPDLAAGSLPSIADVDDEREMAPMSVVALSQVPLQVLSPSREADDKYQAEEEANTTAEANAEAEKIAPLTTQQPEPDQQRRRDGDYVNGSQSEGTQETSLESMIQAAELENEQATQEIVKKQATQETVEAEAEANAVNTAKAVDAEDGPEATIEGDATVSDAAEGRDAGASETPQAGNVTMAAESLSERQTSEEAEHHTAATRVQKMFHRRKAKKSPEKHEYRPFKTMAMIRYEAVAARREKQGLPPPQEPPKPIAPSKPSPLPSVLRTKPPKPPSPPTSPKKHKTPQSSHRQPPPLSQRLTGRPGVAQAQQPPDAILSADATTKPVPTVPLVKAERTQLVQRTVDDADSRPWFLRCFPADVLPNFGEVPSSALEKRVVKIKEDTSKLKDDMSKLKEDARVTPLLLDDSNVLLASDIELLTATIQGMHSQFEAVLDRVDMLTMRVGSMENQISQLQRDQIVATTGHPWSKAGGGVGGENTMA